MPEGIITTCSVRHTPDGRGIEVEATLDAGEVLPGMFIHVPLSKMLDFTVRVQAVAVVGANCLRLLLECGDDGAGAKLRMVFISEDETLEVLETGEA